MRLLLDSHVALWWLNDDPQLGSRARAAIVDADQVFVSAVTPWELGIKRALGKLSFPQGFSALIIEQGFESLPIRSEHAERAPELPPHHRDPFDRMLLAQAELEQLRIVTADGQFEAYGLELVAARS
jgi:PIN domain nuclease of toxin-antitoxin system